MKIIGMNMREGEVDIKLHEDERRELTAMLLKYDSDSKVARQFLRVDEVLRRRKEKKR